MDKIDPQEINELVKALSYLDQPEEIPVPIEAEIVDSAEASGDYSRDSPGALLSYKMRFPKDNPVANIILATEYNVRQCQRVYSNYKVILLMLECTNCDDAGSEAEMYGWLGMMLPGPSTWDYLWYITEANSQRVIPDIGGVLHINTSTNSSLTYATSESYIILGGQLYEDDQTGDDYLVARTKNVYLEDFTGDGHIADFSLMITPLDKWED
jgi:thiol-activated cytolysin